ncbi:MAG: DUF3613 domain-containing protein [Stenotrophobium sp.]
MKKLILVLACALPFAAFAQSSDSPYHLGDDVRAWTDLQVSGSASLNQPRPMPGEIADEIYDRYLQSFKQPIPEQFGRQSFVGAGGAGGAGGGGSH